MLDLKCNDRDLAILDTSATCHMPDVLEMPYRPRILGAAEPGELPTDEEASADAPAATYTGGVAGYAWSDEGR